MIGNPDVDYLSWAMNWGIAYDLPNNSWVAEQRHKKVLPKPIVQRRHRRDLYNRIEVAIDKYAFHSTLRRVVFALIIDWHLEFSAWDTMAGNAYSVRCAKVRNISISEQRT